MCFATSQTATLRTVLEKLVQCGQNLFKYAQTK